MSSGARDRASVERRDEAPQHAPAPAPSAGGLQVLAQAGNRAVARLLSRLDDTVGGTALDPHVAGQIDSHRGSGAPLPDSVQGPLQRQLGADLGPVRVHTDTVADDLCRAVQARAFTTGTDIFFSSGSYRPGSPEGRELIAHEAVHVAQQGTGGFAREERVSDPSDPAETEAARLAPLLAAGIDRPDGSEVGPSLVGLLAPAGNRATARAVQRLIQRAPGGVNQSQDLSALDDTALQAEYQRVARELAGTAPGSPEYATTQQYLSTVESAMASRPGITASPAAQPGVEDLSQLILNQRAFGATKPGTVPAIDPAGLGAPLGPGYQTNAGVMVTDGSGRQLATRLGQYPGGGGPHAEEQAIGQLTDLPDGAAAGGELVVVVDQAPCSRCQTALLAEARRLGARRVVAYGPSRPPVGQPDAPPVRPKTAARTWAQGTREGAPPREEPVPVEVWSAETGATPPVPAEPLPPVEEPGIAPGEVPPEGGPSGGGAALSFAAGLFYQWAHQGAVEERRDTEGYAPVGPAEFADEGLLSRIGRWLADPFLDTQADLGSRLNVPVWRARIREAAATRPPGGTLEITYQVAVPSATGLPGLQSIDDVPVTYTRQPDGRWTVTSSGTFPSGVTVPDLNAIVDPAVSDADVRTMLEYHGPGTEA